MKRAPGPRRLAVASIVVVSTSSWVAAQEGAPRPRSRPATARASQPAPSAATVQLHRDTVTTYCMHVAAGRGLDDVIRYLAAHGAKPGRTDKQGRTPLNVALGMGAGTNTRGATGPRESTAVLLRELMGVQGPKAAL